MPNYDNTIKGEARARQFDGLPRVSSLLTLPSADALCVAEMQRRGIVDATTQQVWVECDPALIPTMRRSAARLGVHPRIVLGDLEQFQPDRMFDLVNLDLMGRYGIPLGRWIEESLSHYLTDDAAFLLTLARADRDPYTQDFVRWFDKQVLDNDALFDARERINLAAQGALSEEDNSIVVRDVLMTICSLHAFVVRVEVVHKYRDTYPMTCFRVSLTRRTELSPIPSFIQLTKDYTKITLQRAERRPSLTARPDTSPPADEPPIHDGRSLALTRWARANMRRDE